MAPRGTRADHYRAIAGFYGFRLIDDIRNPNVPEFVILRDARRVAHYALVALALAARPRRRPVKAIPLSAGWMPASPAGATSGSIPA